MIDALYALALIGCFFGVVDRRVSALALFSSAVVTEIIFVRLTIDYNPMVWWLIDMAVICAIVSRWPVHYTLADLAIVLLFIPCWAIAYTETRQAADITNVIATVQLLLATPWQRLVQDSRTAIRRLREQDRDLWRVAYA